MQVTPYLYFDGRADEALAFYQKHLGAELGMLMRFKDMPPGQPTMGPPPPAEKVMHAQFKVGDTVVFASDGRCGGSPEFKGFALSLNPATAAEADRLFAALGEGGRSEMPLTETFFASRFGMVVDKFGVMWLVIVERPR